MKLNYYLAVVAFVVLFLFVGVMTSALLQAHKLSAQSGRTETETRIAPASMYRGGDKALYVKNAVRNGTVPNFTIETVEDYDAVREALLSVYQEYGVTRAGNPVEAYKAVREAMTRRGEVVSDIRYETKF